MSRLKKLYASSPVWLQNVMVSGQGLLFDYRRWDVRLGRKLLDELRESQWWTDEQFAEFQNARLREHVQYAATRIPYYAKLFKKEGIDPTSIHNVEDVRKIPSLEKEDIRKCPDQFLKDGRLHFSWNKGFTSGTTGTPLHIYTSRESFTRAWSFVFRLREWAGLSDPIHPRRVQFTGRDIVSDKAVGVKKVYWRYNVPGNALLMSTSHLTSQTVPAYAEKMLKFNPELVDGYPSALLVVARVASRLNLELPRPRGIITTAETLFEEDRREIEAAFQCKVYNQYASSDTAAFISECEHGVLHINPEYGVCEILDEYGESVKEGEEGEIVATSFCNREQVFLRYKIGDCGVVGLSEPCKCGRLMPRVQEVTGRTDDILFFPDRGFVGRLDPIFKGLTGIVEAQIIQQSLNRIKLLVVPQSPYDNSIESSLVENLRAKVGLRTEIVVSRTDRIPRGRNGKFRSVVSLCRDQYPDM